MGDWKLEIGDWRLGGADHRPWLYATHPGSGPGPVRINLQFPFSNLQFPISGTGTGPQFRGSRGMAQAVEGDGNVSGHASAGGTHESGSGGQAVVAAASRSSSGTSSAVIPGQMADIRAF